MTAPVSDTNDSEDGEETSEEEEGTSDDPTTNDPSMTTTGEETTSPMTTEPMTTGSECTAEDECMVPTDCPTPGSDCISCLCVGGEETGSDPMSSDYGPCDMCAAGEMPVQIMGIEGCFCSPTCDGAMDMCPDPNEGSAIAVCALGAAMQDPTQCALVCPPGMEGICPTGAMCQDTGMMDPMGNPIGLCTHPA